MNFDFSVYLTNENMAKFRAYYNADLKRYRGKPVCYLRVFHYLYRRATFTSFRPLQLLYKVMFRFWSNRRGLEISTANAIGGDCIWGMLKIS